MDGARRGMVLQILKNTYLYISALHCKHTRALTFENLGQERALDQPLEPGLEAGHW
jgi:hypothetical protein